MSGPLAARQFIKNRRKPWQTDKSIMQTSYLDPFMETLGREALSQVQLKKFQFLLHDIFPTNAF